jgi:hypothetical protein
MKISKGLCVVSALLFVSPIATAKDTHVSTSLLDQRVQLLESALQPDSVDALVKMFADAVTKRNGAVQYMLLCPDLQKKRLAGFQEMNWVTGTSSPSVISYKVNKISANKYSINFAMGLQGKVVDKMIDEMQIKEDGKHYCISEYSRS